MSGRNGTGGHYAHGDLFIPGAGFDTARAADQWPTAAAKARAQRRQRARIARRKRKAAS